MANIRITEFFDNKQKEGTRYLSEILSANNDLGGTFKDNARAPIHRWFYYPTGFSFNLTNTVFRYYQLGSRHTVLDPFLGSGTTCIVAKLANINSIGIEAHPFIVQMAKAKLFWEFDQKELIEKIKDYFTDLHVLIEENHQSKYLSTAPELLMKSLSQDSLNKLFTAREIMENISNEQVRLFIKIALAMAIRKVPSISTSWPYILPKKKTKMKEADVLLTLKEALQYQLSDIKCIQSKMGDGKKVKVNMREGDARNLHFIEDESVDLAFTSPPYLNNFDYSDRTRLEMYFFGEAQSWGEITKKVRRKLMISATTQIKRSEWEVESILDENIPEKIRLSLQLMINKLSKIRLTKGGRKSYDIMVGGYFNDMYKNLKEVHRVLKPNTPYILILGDSAPYGVHIETDVILGKIGLGIGYSSYSIVELRKRGDKWKSAPKHAVPLREVVVILEK
ncbi:MAG: DNA methyltransferase [Candidatus Hodarchaeales archaeon]